MEVKPSQQTDDPYLILKSPRGTYVHELWNIVEHSKHVLVLPVMLWSYIYSYYSIKLYCYAISLRLGDSANSKVFKFLISLCQVIVASTTKLLYEYLVLYFMYRLRIHSVSCMCTIKGNKCVALVVLIVSQITNIHNVCVLCMLMQLCICTQSECVCVCVCVHVYINFVGIVAYIAITWHCKCVCSCDAVLLQDSIARHFCNTFM